MLCVCDTLSTGTTTKVTRRSTPESLGSDDTPVLESVCESDTKESEPEVTGKENDHNSSEVVDTVSQHGTANQAPQVQKMIPWSKK